MRIIKGLENAKHFLSRRPSFEKELTFEEVVAKIADDVRENGDAALFGYSEKLDKVKLNNFKVEEDEVARAYKVVNKELVDALKFASKRIRDFHLLQKEHLSKNFMGDGVGQVVRPLKRVGIYAPGGKASYPSTVLMTAIPAKVAGVEEVVLTTPPLQDGSISSATLVAADIAEVDQIFKLGGAQAIAALAFGTQSVPKVDKICGPGNIFVTLAKKKVFGVVGIDGLQGPTETLILADESANPALCAADLLAQAEHDELASAILITTSSELAERVQKEIEQQLKNLGRQAVAEASFEENGGIITVESMAQAIELVNFYAPEHLSLMVQGAESYIDKIYNAGGIFVGENSPEVLGDYVAGPSHVMPTGGTARFSSPLGVQDFLKVSNVIALDGKELKMLANVASIIANAERLTAHARAAEMRIKD